MIKSARLAALVLLIMPIVAACGRNTGSAGPPSLRSIYASRLSLSDVTPVVGDAENWWPAAPTFDVPPLNSATRDEANPVGLVVRFAHLGTAEMLEFRYQVWVDTSIATNIEDFQQTVFGTPLTGPAAGDKALYYNRKLQVGAAPFTNVAYLRVGQTTAIVVWSHIDGYASTKTFGHLAVKTANRLKDALAGKLHPPSPEPTDTLLLPPATTQLTLLGTTHLPLQVLPGILSQPGPTGLMSDLKRLGATDLVFGDYTLDLDTRMEVQTVGIAFGTQGTGGEDWIAGFFAGGLSSTGEFSQYFAGLGIYMYGFGVGPRAVVMVCKSSNDGEEAGRSCEASMGLVVGAWHPHRSLTRLEEPPPLACETFAE